MRVVTSIALSVVLLFLLANQALANNLFTVRVGQSVSRPNILIDNLQNQKINNLWLSKKNNAYVLNAGIFPDRKYAKLLLDQLRIFAPLAEIVSAELPASEQWVSQQKTISLREIGYEQPVLLQGVQPYYAVHFPWNNSMDIKSSSLNIGLRISPSLKTNSTVTILAEGVPLMTFLKREIINREFVSIRLDALENLNIGSTLDIEISGSFRATEDYCVDMRSKNLWLSLDSATYLRFTQLTPSLSVKSFFLDAAAMFHFVSFAQDRNSIEAVTRIAGLIGSLSFSKYSRIQFGSYSLAGKNIFVGSFAKDMTVLGNNIFITPDGSKLLKDTIFPALIFTKLSGKSMDSSPVTVLNDSSFEMLGYRNRTAQGIGDLLFSTQFSALQLGGWPKKILATIFYTHSPVLANDRSSLRIRLNGVLVESRNISGDGGGHSLTFTLPSRAIQVKNNLEIVFSYYLNTGECIGSYPEFEVALMKESFLSVESYNPKPHLTLSNYPAVFKGRGALLLSRFNSEYYEPLARLMEIQGHLQQAIPDIAITELTHLDTTEFDYAVMALDPEETTVFMPPVDLAQRLKIINPLSNKVLVDLETKESITALQTFYFDKKLPALLYQQRNIVRSPLDFVTEVLSSHSQANIGIISDTEWYAMEVGKKIHVVYPDKKNIAYYWQKYRFIFFLLIGAILLLFLFYVYHRLAKEK